MPDTPPCWFTDSHEWFQEDGDLVTVGITQYAVNELTDITYVEMRPPGTVVQSGDVIGDVESVKAANDVFTAVGGEIVEVNDALSTDPSLLNSDPAGNGWIVKIRVDHPDPLHALMDRATYDGKYPIA